MLAILLFLAGCATALRTIPAAWMSVPQAARIGSLTLADDGTVTPSAQPAPTRLSDGAFHAMGASLMSGRKVLAEKLGAIDSLDLSESRGEVVFSAKPHKDFDIGLISTDGGAVHWMPRDPADEVDVQWAPRGNKISYIIRGSGGDLVRTLHIPTAFQLAVPFPGATIRALAWEPKAEHYAVAYSTLLSSEQVDVLKYDGADHHTAIPPARRLDVEAVPLARGATLLHPHDIRSAEQLPIVVWRSGDASWSDARAALLAHRRIAVIVTPRAPDADFWRAIAAIKWLDRNRVYIVDSASDVPAPAAGQLLITADPTVAAGRYRRRGDIVAVAPAVVQSFAAGFIAEQLERTHPTNGSSR
jgi:hypothetical protein